MCVCERIKGRSEVGWALMVRATVRHDPDSDGEKANG